MKKTLVKKSFAWLLALVMIIGFIPAYAFAADGDQDGIDDDVKFQMKVSSEASDKTIGAVTAIVYKDYKAVVTYKTSDKVNPSNVTANVWMQNVASLGVTNLRHYAKTVNTGINHEDVALTAVDLLFNGLNGKNTTVTAKIGELSTNYSISYSKDSNNEVTITGIPDSNVDKVWHAIVDNNIVTGTKGDDSYLVIPNGSSLQIGNEVLQFQDNYSEDLLRIDNITNENLPAIVNGIKDAVEVVGAQENDGTVKFTLKAGTELALSSSYAKLNKDMTVTVSGLDMEKLNGTLSALRNAANNQNNASDLIVQTLAMIKNSIDSAAGKNVMVEFSFAQPDNYKFRARVSSVDNGSEGAVTATVKDDYTTDIIVSGSSVNTSNVKGEVWMQNVESLGVTTPRHYERALQLSETGQPVALDKVSSLLGLLDKTKIIGKVGNDQVEYTFTKVNDTNFTFNPDKEDNARKVWHKIVNKDNIEAGTNEDDSYIVIGNGCSLQVGQYILEFEDNYDGNLKLDDFGNLETMDSEIRKAVVLNKVESPVYDKIIIKLADGTELDVGSSYAKLNKCCTINVSGDAVTETNIKQLEDALIALRVNNLNDENTDTIHALWNLLGQMVGMVSGTTTTVEYKFGHDLEETLEDAATCETSGTEAYYTCSICGKMFSDKNGTKEITKPIIIPALNHEWGTPKYVWSDDNSTVTATAVCERNNSHTITETVNSSSKDTKAPTETEPGERIYTATFDNKVFEIQTKTEVIPATGGGDTPGGGGGEGPGGGDGPGTIDDPDVPLAGPEHDPYMNGKAEGIFDPMGNFTRAEAATVLSRLTEGFKEDGNYTGADFSDVKSADWFYKYVSFAQLNKLVNGYADGTYQPNKPITRQEFAVLLARFLDIEPVEPADEFSDMDKAGDWAKGYVAAMKTNGIIEGYEDGTFRPTNNITRAEAATMLNRVLDRVPLEELELEKKGYENPFTDVNVSEWFFVQVMEATIEHKISDFHE